MKREAFNHPKLKLVARDLDLPIPYVRGIMESIWHVTAASFPRGDLGRITDEEIAMAIDYPGDSKALIKSLVKRRLLDTGIRGVRLYVHDWHEHADDSLNWKVARAGKPFANGIMSKRAKGKDDNKQVSAEAKEEESVRRRQTKSESDCLPTPTPTPTPPTELIPPTPLEKGGASDQDGRRKSRRPSRRPKIVKLNPGESKCYQCGWVGVPANQTDGFGQCGECGSKVAINQEAGATP